MPPEVRIAFHAPMKPPDHPVPSGDRRMARALMALLRDLGHEVVLASRFRSFEGRGDTAAQQAIARAGAAEAQRLCAAYRRGERPRPDLWFTYHLYHKAPDHLGPELAETLGIPYLVAEASVAGKQRNGPWAAGFEAALEALRRADLVLAMTARDEAGLRHALGPEAPIRRLRPFLDTAPFAAMSVRKRALKRALAERLGLHPDHPFGLVVAMMREDVKRRSYHFLIEALSRIEEPLDMVVAGDGPARAEIARRFADLSLETRLIGGVCPAALPELYGACDLFLWPGFGEAYGMAYLEAQAAGLPVVALNTAGVAEVVVEGKSGILVREERPEAFAAAIHELLDADSRRRRAETAMQHVRANHGLAPARETLAAALEEAIANHRHREEHRPCAS